jgi:hypothetical protein
MPMSGVSIKPCAVGLNVSMALMNVDTIYRTSKQVFYLVKKLLGHFLC